MKKYVYLLAFMSLDWLLAGDDLDQIFENGDNAASGEESQGTFDGTKSAVLGFVRFLNSLSK